MSKSIKKKPLVVLSHSLPDFIVKEELLSFARVKIAKNATDLKALLPKADGLVSLLTVQINEKLLSLAPNLKVVGNVAVGINNVDTQALIRHGVRLTNTPDVLTRATAELTLALLMAAARRIPEGESLCRTGKFKGWAHDMLLGLELQGRHAVILGKGRIGQDFAKLLQALDMTVEFITRADSPEQVNEKLSRAQIFSIHVPYSKDSHHWLSARRIAALPKDSIVLNTARGPIVEEKALIRALQKKKIFAAGLDVFEFEPAIPPALRKLKNVVILPHIGSATQKTRAAMARLACSGVATILKGGAPSNEVMLQK